ncbi:MAG: L-seryl-tRNA(Sec) selenium transferase [Planctomycetes bacterium]|nr:L-seryl-tRNA(Sec) selenium transferase [Planctomycetota bacterium]
MTSANPSPYRILPAMDRLLRLQDASTRCNGLESEAARCLVLELKERIQAGESLTEADVTDEVLRARLEALREVVSRPQHRRVLNLTGILLHTGLGRAPLAETARRAMLDVAGQAYVEVSAETGLRNRREDAIARHLCAITGAEAATVLNNNAAATLLGLQALASGREVILSRSELVEIGGGFRMPDVMEQAGCTLVEVGTTNRTRRADYEAAIGDATGCLLKVHPSNYRIEGFFAEVELTELVALGDARDVPVMEDLGSGWLLDEPLPHDPREPGVLASVATGADLVTFSGDKLLGACQAGFVVGRKAAVERVKRHPLYRALRLGKCELAALEATLMIYRFGDPKRDIPILRAMFTPVAELEQRCERLRASLDRALRSLGFVAEVGASPSFVGSGASPARPLESRALWLRRDDERGPKIEELARLLRLATPAVFARIENDRLVLDLRSLPPEDDEDLVSVFESLQAHS